MAGTTGLEVTGLEETKAALQAYIAAAQEHGSTQGWQVLARAVYAAGIETGRRRGGGLARKAGGLHFLEHALDQAASSAHVQDLLAEGLPDAPDAIRGLRQRLANDVAERARRLLTPFPYSPLTRIHSSVLRDSIAVTRAGESAALFTQLIPAVARRGRGAIGRRA